MLTAQITETIRMNGKKSNETVSLTFDSYSALFRSILVDTGDAVLFTREDVQIEDLRLPDPPLQSWPPSDRPRHASSLRQFCLAARPNPPILDSIG